MLLYKRRMTTAEFQSRFPKPWRFVRQSTSFTLRAANNAVVASLGLSHSHSGIPQAEWNRHMAAALSEYMQVTEEPLLRSHSNLDARGKFVAPSSPAV